MRRWRSTAGILKRGLAKQQTLKKKGITMKDIRVRITLTDEMLGTMAADKNIHREYIASKAPDALSIEEEIAAIGEEEYAEKQMTVFPRLENGTPFMWDYQIRGFFKDACAALQRCKGEDIAKNSCSMKAYKKIIDGCIFVSPRKIPLTFTGEIGICQRPLRGQTAQGERIALASSETVPEGTTAEFTIRCLSDAHMPAVREWLDYGQYKGLLQWRNSGKGRFEWEEIE